MTNREPLTAALLLFLVADYQKNCLGTKPRKVTIMNGYEKFKIKQELSKIRAEIEEMKKARITDLDGISNYILKLENHIENLKER